MYLYSTCTIQSTQRGEKSENVGIFEGEERRKTSFDQIY